jgi:hypothetical protein
LIDADDHVPRALVPLGGIIIGLVDEQELPILVPVLEVSPQRRLQIQVLEDLPRRVPVLAERAHDGRLDPYLELLLQLIDDFVDHLAGEDTRLRVEQLLVGEQRLHQLDVRLDLLEQIGLVEELGDPAALDQLALEHLLRLTGEQVRDRVHPAGHREAGPLGSAALLALVEEIQRRLHALRVAVAGRDVDPARRGVLAQSQPPPRQVPAIGLAERGAPGNGRLGYGRCRRCGALLLRCARGCPARRHQLHSFMISATRASIAAICKAASCDVVIVATVSPSARP